MSPGLATLAGTEFGRGWCRGYVAMADSLAEALSRMEDREVDGLTSREFVDVLREELASARKFVEGELSAAAAGRRAGLGDRSVQDRPCLP